MNFVLEEGTGPDKTNRWITNDVIPRLLQKMSVCTNRWPILSMARDLYGVARSNPLWVSGEVVLDDWSNVRWLVPSQD